EILIGTLTNEAPLYSFDSIPFMLTGYDQAKKLWEAVRPSVEARLDKQNLKTLYSVAWPSQGIYTKDALTTVDALKDLRFRASSASIAELTKRVGASSVVVQVTEVTQAFLTGMVSAMLTSSSTGVDTQAWDYAKYFYNVPTMLPQ